MVDQVELVVEHLWFVVQQVDVPTNVVEKRQLGAVELGIVALLKYSAASDWVENVFVAELVGKFVEVLDCSFR